MSHLKEWQRAKIKGGNKTNISLNVKGYYENLLAIRAHYDVICFSKSQSSMISLILIDLTWQ